MTIKVVLDAAVPNAQIGLVVRFQLIVVIALRLNGLIRKQRRTGRILSGIADVVHANDSIMDEVECMTTMQLNRRGRGARRCWRRDAAVTLAEGRKQGHFVVKRGRGQIICGVGCVVGLADHGIYNAVVNESDQQEDWVVIMDLHSQ